jgi:hypothetical protein
VLLLAFIARPTTHKLTAAAAVQQPAQQGSAMPLRYKAGATGFTLPVRLTSAMPVQRGTSSIPQHRSPHYSSQESVSSVEADQMRAVQQQRHTHTHTHASRPAHDYTRGLSSRSTSSGGSACSSVGSSSSSSSSSRTSVRRAAVAASVSSLEAGEQRVLRSQELEPGEIRRC